MKIPRTVLLVATLATLAGANPLGAIVAGPTWRTARIVALPSGGTGLPQGYLPVLSCTSARNCAAGGAYSDAAGSSQGLLLEEVAGVWRAPRRVVAPPNAAADPGLTVGALSCATARNCAAGGGYQEKGGNLQSFVATEVRGTWSGAQEVILPPDAFSTGQTSSIRSMSCASAGNCSAVGSYIDVNGATHGLTVDEVNGTWAPSQPVTLPGDANAFPGASLSELNCVSAANCTAIGSYTNAAGAIEGLAVAERHGRWDRAVALQMPSGAAANPHVFLYGFNGLSCPSVANCSAGGQYRDTKQLYQGFLVNEVNGHWTIATELVLPNGAQAAGKNGGVVAVSCSSASHCSAGAAYLDSANNYQALVVSETANTWLTGTTLKLPRAAATVGVDGGVYGLACNAATSCTATGSYLGSTTTYQGFTVATR